jgi:quercetin dioxygenase-like cupin family protein
MTTLEQEDSMISSKATRFTVLKLVAVGIGGVGLAHSAAPSSAKATPLMTRPLAGIPGKEGTMLTVEFPPGADTPSHRHNANTFVYVLQGSVIMQVAGGPLMTLRAGDTFYESPSDVHSVSKNASATEPARILVFFVKDQGAPPTVPAKE